MERSKFTRIQGSGAVYGKPGFSRCGRLDMKGPPTHRETNDSGIVHTYIYMSPEITITRWDNSMSKLRSLDAYSLSYFKIGGMAWGCSMAYICAWHVYRLQDRRERTFSNSNVDNA